MAAVVWVGAAFAFLVLPMAGPATESAIIGSAERGYRELTDVAVPVFLLTGAMLTFDRFARSVPSATYVGVLVAKVALAFGMFHLAYRSRRIGLGAARSTVRALCVAATTIVLMAAVLRSLSGA